jgi:hypothetical protein
MLGNLVLQNPPHRQAIALLPQYKCPFNHLIRRFNRKDAKPLLLKQTFGCNKDRIVTYLRHYPKISHH